MRFFKILSLIFITFIILGASYVESETYKINFNTNTNKEFKAIALNPYIYNKSNQNNFRIKDINNNEIPFYYYQLDNNSKKNEHPINLIAENSFNDEKYVYKDYKVEKEFENIDIYINQFEFFTNKVDFIKKVFVLGSYDNTEWFDITNGTIFNVENSSNYIIDFQEQKYKYYRFKFLGIEEKVSFDIFAKYSNHKLTPNNSLDLDIINNIFVKKFQANYSTVTKDGITEISINGIKKTDYTLKNLNIIELKFDIEGNFNRNIDSNYFKNEKLFNLKYKDSEISNMSIKINNTVNEDSLKVFIDNKDDMPLEIKNIEIVIGYDFLIFKGKDKEKYTLEINQNNSNFPDYDIKQMAPYILLEDCEIIKDFEEPIITILNNKEIKKNFNYNFIFIFISLLLFVLVLFNIKKFDNK